MSKEPANGSNPKEKTFDLQIKNLNELIRNLEEQANRVEDIVNRIEGPEPLGTDEKDGITGGEAEQPKSYESRLRDTFDRVQMLNNHLVHQLDRLENHL